MKIVNIERTERRRDKEYGCLATIEVPTEIEEIIGRETSFGRHLNKWLEGFERKAEEEYNAFLNVFVNYPLGSFYRVYIKAYFKAARPKEIVTDALDIESKISDIFGDLSLQEQVEEVMNKEIREHAALKRREHLQSIRDCIDERALEIAHKRTDSAERIRQIREEVAAARTQYQTLAADSVAEENPGIESDIEEAMALTPRPRPAFLF